MRSKNNILSGLFILMLAFLAGYCGIGCGKKGSGDPTPPETQKTISFTPSGSPSGNSVYLEEVSKNNDKITLAVKVKGGTDVNGAILNIKFDGGNISYDTATEGSYLNKGTAGAAAFSAALEQGNSGLLLIGITCKGTVAGITGDGVLAQIVLKALNAQTNTVIEFDTTSALKASTKKNIAGTVFLGGKLSYN